MPIHKGHRVRERVCLRHLLLMVGAWLSLAGLAFAQNGERYALLVGVREYDKNELRSLPYSEADVESLAVKLREAGYRPENVVLMTQTLGARQPRFLPLAANIRKELQLLLANRGAGDTVVVALAGHGVQFRGGEESFFCPGDAQLSQRDTLLPLGEIYKSLEGSKAGFKLLLVDACRNDPQADNSRARQTVSLQSVTRPPAQDPAGGVAAFYSCSPGERAFEHSRLKHGVFFHFIVQGLNGEADLDRDRLVTLPELQQYTARRVPDFVRSEYGVVQTPDLRGSTRGLTPLVKLDAAQAAQLGKTPLRLSGQSVSSRQVVQKVIELLEKTHYSKVQLDDVLARKWLELAILAFDPQKLYFLQSDIDRILAQAASVDDKARLGDVSFAWELLQIWIERRMQVVAWIDAFSEMAHDYSVEEDYTWRVDSAPATGWAADQAALREVWRKRFKYLVLMHRHKGDDPEPAVRKTVRDLNYALVTSVQRVDDGTLLEIALSALGHTLDPNTQFFAPSGAENMKIEVQGRLVGIGAALKMEFGEVIVVKVVPGGPAARDGRLKSGDVITAVATENLQSFRELAGLKLNEVVEMIRGRAGAPLRLKVRPRGADTVSILEITRGEVELSQTTPQIFSEARRDDEQPVRLGYIPLSTIYANNSLSGKSNVPAVEKSTSGDLRGILADFRRQNVDVAILDLRGNPGGSLNESFRVLSLFINGGPVLLIRNRDGSIVHYSADIGNVAWTKPLIVLTNSNTGPGCEIISGALQDYRRALVIGDKSTSGRAMIQSIIDIGEEIVPGNNPPRLGSFKLSKQMFFLPSGRCSLGTGCSPDIALPSFAEMMYEPSPRPDWMSTEPLQSLVQVPCAEISPPILERLRKISEARRAVKPEFQEYLEKIRLATAQRSRNTRSLSEKKFFLDEAQFTPQQDLGSDEGPIVRDAYLNEVFAIALDYLPNRKWQQLCETGRQQLRAKSYAEAVRTLSAAIDADRERGVAFALRSLAYAGTGEWDKALADAKTAGINVVPAVAVAAGTTTVGEAKVGKVTVGMALAIERIQGEWLWTIPNYNSAFKGWLKKSLVAPQLPPE